MGLERRGSHLYYYRKRREGRRVISEYVGGGELGRSASGLDQLEREERQAELAAFRAECDAVLDAGRRIDALEGLVRDLVRVALVSAGLHTHKGQWRKRRDGG